MKRLIDFSLIAQKKFYQLDKKCGKNIHFVFCVLLLPRCLQLRLFDPAEWKFQLLLQMRVRLWRTIS